jgi:hypothetical protein
LPIAILSRKLSLKIVLLSMGKKFHNHGEKINIGSDCIIFPVYYVLPHVCFGSVDLRNHQSFFFYVETTRVGGALEVIEQMFGWSKRSMEWHEKF